MPKFVDDLVKKLLADPDFYPKKSKKKREELAWKIANQKYQDKKKKTESFDGEMPFYIETGIGMIADARDVMNKGFHGVMPYDENSLMLLVRAQTENIKETFWGSKYQVLEECYLNGLPMLEKKPNNKVYSDHRMEAEYTIGFSRKFIPPNQFVLEIQRGENRPHGNIVAQGIKDKRIEAVSTRFKTTQNVCGICGEVGNPRIMCNHIPGEIYDGVENIIKVKRADYYEISTTSRGLDSGALILNFESMSKYFKSEDNDTLIREIIEETKQDSNQRVPTKMSEKNEELIKENTKLAEQMKQMQEQFSQLQSQMNDYKTKFEEQRKENTSLKESNVELSQTLESIRLEEQRQLVEKAVNLRIKAGLITESQKTKDIKYLEDKSQEDLLYEISVAERFIKNKGEIKTTSKATQRPINPDFNTQESQIKLPPGVFGKYASVLKERIELKKSKIEERGYNGRGFRRITEEDRKKAQIGEGE